MTDFAASPWDAMTVVFCLVIVMWAFIFVAAMSQGFMRDLALVGLVPINLGIAGCGLWMMRPEHR